ncbi:uncharacterized protein LOC122014398 [Zingiber officinale]|uniref:uncharacterized protein LOC122014398 n=1 Tax=Zingiber officinale TaxID=94328 RepID=UPI001C4D4CBE|nr:uncharacterized protein LOC122014398 [Zingiber officinale]
MMNDEEERMGEMMNDEEEGMGENDPHNNEKKLMDEACQQILRFFRTSGIPFYCAKNPEFVKIFELVEKCGSKFVPPSYHELKKFSLKKEMKNTIDMLEYKYNWKKTGCSIICDEWTDTKGRFYCDFLMNNPEGTIFLKSIDTSEFSETNEKVFETLNEIVEAVGEEYVIQVITKNTANYKNAVEMLIEKRKKIFWSPCVVQLLDEILEDFENNLSHHWITIGKGKKISTFICSRTRVILMLRDFTKGKHWSIPTITPFATAYLTLLYLIDMKDTLIAMFSSEQWKSNELAKTKEGEEIQQIVQDYGFWHEIVYCMIFALPIIEVLLKIYSDEQPTMGFIYKAMNSAKESLQSWNNIKGYEIIWKIIKQRWNPLLHPQYIASHLLNPQLIYDSTYQFHSESNDGSFAWLAKLIIDYDDDLSMTAENLKKIEHQIVDFSISKGLFGSKAAILMRNTKDPAKWWDSYGKHCPELQKMAIHLLSLTCSYCGTWNGYEQVHPKKSRLLCREKLNDLFCVIQNFKSSIQRVRTKKVESINPEVLSSDKESITSKFAK